MFEIVFLLVISAYFIQTVIFSIGLKKKFPKLSEKDLPSATVIVAARNEEENIRDCLVALNNLIYPEEKLEIIIVDDHSEDNTFAIAKKFIADKPKFKLIRPEKQFGNVKGKANALANAIEISKGEIILTTDADCIVSPTWAKTLASYYCDEKVAMVNGFTTQTNSTAFEGMQAVDSVFLLAAAAGTMNLNRPISCIGNNMSYRKSVYKEVGGYEAIPFSVTEDFMLLKAFEKLKKYKLIYPLDPGGLVVSKACKDLKILYRQRKRWGVGGLDAGLREWIVMGNGWLANIGMVLAPFFYSATSLVVCFFKIFTDFFFLKNVHESLKLKMKFKDFLAFQIYYIVYVIVLPFVAFFSRNVVWKERSFGKGDKK